MVETIDGGWGSLKDDGTWTGMIGMILRDEVDIAISDFYVTAERSMVIDYSQKIVELMYVLSNTLQIQNLVYYNSIPGFSYMIGHEKYCFSISGIRCSSNPREQG